MTAIRAHRLTAVGVGIDDAPAKTCQWRRKPCARPILAQGFCHYHYDLAAHLGLIVAGWVDAASARAILAQHLERGVSCWGLAGLTGLHHDTLYDIHAGRTSHTRAATLAAIRAVPLPPTAIGCVRRVLALRRIGWPLRPIAAEAGLPLRTLTDSLGKPLFTPHVAAAVVAAYDRLSSTRGPSPVAATRAANEGCAPPMAWDGLDIDDPAAVPDLGGATRRSSADLVDEYRHLTGLGVSHERALRQLDTTDGALARARYRASRTTTTEVAA